MSFINGASRQAGSFNRPSSVIEADEVAEAVAAGASSERALATVALANSTQKKHCHPLLRYLREMRNGVSDPAFRLFRLCMSVPSAPPVV
jgi:hypothetical protein